MSTKTATSNFSLVLETPAAEPEVANQYFLSKLAFETDPADVRLDLQRGRNDFVVLDVRSPKDHAECRIAGALNIPYRRISPETTADLPMDKVIVVYCWGLSCNASTKAAFRLSELGFKVKELIGGIEAWRKEGEPVEGTLGQDAPTWG
jgi:rhodanese-related sulfurtransferase